jgi:hypothetical protein
MKTKNKERRVLNIDKEDFDFIKEYCDANAFNMPKWVVKICVDYINKKLEKTIKGME